MTMKLYKYEGDVLIFSEIIKSKWSAETSAMSDTKAIANFCYQFKKQYGFAATARISLAGDIIKIA